jgi:hypothetical protein
MQLHLIISSILILSASTRSPGQSIDNSKAVDSQFEIIVEFHSHIQETKTKIFFSNNLIKVLKKQATTKINDDQILFSAQLSASDSLNFMDRIQYDSLRPYYLNPCVNDGFALEIFFSKNGRTKHIMLDNYYQDDIGKIINFINARLPVDYRIKYDKNKLTADYKKCEDLLHKESINNN